MAAAKWGMQAPHSEPLKISVTYFHEQVAIRLDNDNMVKPIQDALIGLIYADDRLVTDTVVRKTRIDGSFRVRWISLAVLEAFAKGEEFLHVVIDRAPSHEELLR